MKTRLRLRHVLALSIGVSAIGVGGLTLAETKKPDPPSYDTLRVMSDVLSIINSDYVEPVEMEALMDGALNGALSRLDPHSTYIRPQRYVQQRESAKREYGGLGIEVSMEGGLVKVNFALEDGPAYAAGIRPGDFITAVDGDMVLGKNLDEAVEGMRGLEGDAITVTVLSPDQTSRDVEIIRAVVRGRAVRHRVEQGLAYVSIDTFNNDKLTSDLIRALELLELELGGEIPGLIIDLRGNRGGLLTESISVSGLFLDGGEVLSARGRNNIDTERYHAELGELYPDMKIVVLMSPGSASAAEIVAGALQDRGRGLVVGRRSFGKGSVQSVIPLPQQKGALRLTTQRYFTPSGKSIQGRGIMPDLIVSALEDDGELRKRFREDSLPNSLINEDVSEFQERYDDVIYPPAGFDISQDYQLRKAVDILKTSAYERLLDAQSDLD